MLDKLARPIVPYLRPRHVVAVATGSAVAVALLGAALAPVGGSGPMLATASPPKITTTEVLGTVAPPTTSVPATTVAPVKPRPKPAPAPVRRSRKLAAPVLVPAGVRPFVGLGTWVDMYSWSAAFTGGNPTFGFGDIDAMAALGVQTLYLQGASQTTPGVLEPDRLVPLIARAHQRGIRVVAWYLPSLTDLSFDYGQLAALGHLAIDGLGVDIESRDDPNVADRNARLVVLSEAIRQELPRTPLGAIVLPPTLLEVVNPNYWPGFPWRAIAPYYDAWLPMDYWTGRRPESGFQDGYTYTADSVIRLRNDLGLPAAVVHPIGGDAGQVAPGDVDRFVAAIRQTHSVGGSLYAWRQTGGDDWPRLQALRS